MARFSIGTSASGTTAASLLCLALAGPALAQGTAPASPAATAGPLAVAFAPLFAGPDGLAAARELLVSQAATGGWPALPRLQKDGKLEPGDEDATWIPALRRRLVASGDLDPSVAAATGAESARFDESLAEAVRRFQRRHGLDPDGVVGRATAAALAVPIAARLRQIDLNLERRRALPSSLGERFLLINLPAFELEAIEANRRELAMKMVVGRRTMPSPELSADATHIKLNPYWNVPASIARRELAPKEAKEPGHLAKQAIRVFRDRDGREEVDAGTVDWSAFANGERTLFLRQEPGPRNSLGRLSVQVPNRDNVCLHDTPEKGAFSRPMRALSHGCLRLERAFELAVYLLRGDPVWSAERLGAALERGEQRDIVLPEPVPVHVVYWTAWTDVDGVLQFRDDVYGRDRRN